MQLHMILFGVSVIQSEAVKQDAGVRPSTVGENVTLHCFYNSQSAMHFSWYQQMLGGKPKLLSTVYKYDVPSKTLRRLEKTPRFSVQTREGINHLHISDVHLSDAATYYCGSSHSNTVKFGEGVFLSVQGSNSPENIQDSVSETFSCMIQTKTCEEGLTAQWLRHGSQQGVLHTHKNNRRSISAKDSPPQSCVYHLQNESLGPVRAGAYSSAVASCSRMLSGNGSKLLIGQNAEEQAVQLKVFLWLSVIRGGIVFLCVTFSLLAFVRKIK
ncbi:uncharacterized protein [Nothobranchius furzeri]|uniref:LOC107372326-like protein n=1 Tax=Nothobranchius furzeri TaxID=105023 RepID=A0A8C6LVT4_NOTFU|nr:uncharacterized protein LOC107372326 [Nothobranchius furzeri]KAF7208982.1 putative LOC107372326-like protein [Nothobranchius furzeri]